MPDAVLQQLLDAVARNTGAVLSLPSAGMLRHQKSRFLAAGDSGFWMECEREQLPLVAELIASQKSVGVSYKGGPLKTVFTTTLLEQQAEYRINADTVVCAVRLKAPAEIKQMQRRQSYRVRVPADYELRLEIWRIAPRVVLRDKPNSTAKLECELLDISTGGLGVIFIGQDGDKPRVCEEDRLRIQILAGDVDLLIEGSMRSPQPGKDPMRLRSGIQFKALENDLEGRQNLAKLQKIVGELQRHEARRMRLGVA